VAYAGTSSFNNSGNVYPVLGSTGNFAATTVSTVVPTVFNPNQVVLSPTARTGTTTPNYYLVGDALNAYATLTNAATGAPAAGVTVVFTDSARPARARSGAETPRAHVPCRCAASGRWSWSPEAAGGWAGAGALSQGKAGAHAMHDRSNVLAPEHRLA